MNLLTVSSSSWLKRKLTLSKPPSLTSMILGRSSYLNLNRAGLHSHRNLNTFQPTKSNPIFNGRRYSTSSNIQNDPIKSDTKINWFYVATALAIPISGYAIWKGSQFFSTNQTDADIEEDEEEEEIPLPVEEPEPVQVDQVKEWLELLLPETPLFAIAILTSFASSLISLYIPKLMGNLIDMIKSIDSPSEGAPLSVFTKPGAICVAIILSQTGLNFLFNYVLSVAGDNIGRRLRRKLFVALLKKDIEFFDKVSTGELISAVSSDVTEVKMAVKHTVSLGMKSLTQIAGGFISLFLLSSKLTTILILIMPSMVFVGTFSSRIIQRLSKSVQQSLAKSTGVAEESISNIKTVRSFVNEEKEAERYGSALDLYSKLSSQMGRSVGLFHAFTNICVNGGFMFILLYGGKMIATGEMTGGTLTSYIMYSLTLQSSMINLSILQGELVKGLGSATRIFETINQKQKIPLRGGQTLPSVKGRVEFKEVSFRYPSRHRVQVLKKLNLTLEEGKKYAIVGPSGSGKSTIAQLIERFYDAEGGSIFIDDVNIKDLDPSWLRRHIALVSQEPVLFATSIFENIRFGNPDATMEDVVRAARLANAENFITQFPSGYDTVVGERGMQLSGGQKQRIAIARAILKNAKILILDEATSALDAESEHLVQDALDTLMEGRTVLMIAHRLSTVKKADQILVMRNGKIIESGTHNELLKKKGAYSHLVAKQMHTT